MASTITSEVKVRDVEIVCCTTCCPCLRPKKGNLEGHSVSHITRARAVADLDIDPSAPKAPPTHMTVTVAHVRRASDIITVERKK